ncbi:MAG: phosphoribosylaminoimidazolesuccinocarboxamide synthase [Elusimicrobia bacterium RIFOXYD2_FULL_34_30]|nr:MAG: phosphoribosylaminoimidazolesuccinocarboxamide synthase [Elusimicrobia bacterium RIFOXYD2_FULL_34_30]
MDAKKIYSGKVRDVYKVGEDKLLIVATDRISCFDFILPTLVPDKGKILTKISVFWFNYLKDIIENHLISSDINEISKIIPNDIAKDLGGRSMLVKKGKRVDIEVIIRGYLSGSAWKEYQKSSSVCGIKLPMGLKESEKLPEIIFTPSTKAPDGEHDINITEKEAEKIAGKDIIKIIKEKSILIYKKASEYALSKGIIIADTKFEFGIVDGKVILIDEIFTPDSSRFWDKEKYSPGKSQENFDKQFVRDYLISINWNKQPPVPELPKDIVDKTKARYLEVQRRLCE